MSYEFTFTQWLCKCLLVANTYCCIFLICLHVQLGLLSIESVITIDSDVRGVTVIQVNRSDLVGLPLLSTTHKVAHTGIYSVLLQLL